MKVWKLSNVTACKMRLQRREGEMQLTDRHTAFCHSEPTGGRLGTCGSHGVDSPTTLQLDTRMDATEENNMEDMKMEIQTNQTIDKDFLATSDDANQHLTIGDGPSSSCRKVWVRSRPKLQSTKSFPPYSQCIGGLGDNRELDCEINCESNFYQLPFRHETVRSDGHADIQRTERNDVVLTPRCTREEVKFKWRMMRLGGSYEVDPDGWERGRWSGKRRVGETGQEPCERDDKGGEEGTNSEWKHCRSKNTSLETMRRETDDEHRSGSVSATEGERDGSEEAAGAKDEEVAGLTSGRRGSTAHGQPSPHPILSKLLHSSSSTSSSNLSSPDSDEVFSEEEDAYKKRKTFRKSRSWKPYLTMVHWSLRRQSSWVQLGGHQGNFQLGEGGEVLKLYSEVEAKCLDCLMGDTLRPFVPQYHGLVSRGENCYIRLEDLLSGLKRPVIMDCKMGVRTYQEEELTRARTRAALRSDMYHKMVKIDPSAPSEEEHAARGVTKWRYLQWRDSTSSTCTLGFRIEGMMMDDGSIQRDFRKILTLAQLTEALLYFTRRQLGILKAYHSRLLALSDALMNSQFFRTHEMIGSSLLFVHDHSSKANVWMIDFGKTTPVSSVSELRHNVPWAEGSREDGYLIGLTSLIASLNQAIDVASWQQEGSCEEAQTVI